MKTLKLLAALLVLLAAAAGVARAADIEEPSQAAFLVARGRLQVPQPLPRARQHSLGASNRPPWLLCACILACGTGRAEGVQTRRADSL